MKKLLAFLILGLFTFSPALTVQPTLQDPCPGCRTPQLPIQSL